MFTLRLGIGLVLVVRSNSNRKKIWKKMIAVLQREGNPERGFMRRGFKTSGSNKSGNRVARRTFGSLKNLMNLASFKRTISKYVGNQI